MTRALSTSAVRRHYEALANEARGPGAYRISPERQAKLDEAMAQINAAFPKPIGPAEIFAKLIAAGQPVLIIHDGLTKAVRS